VHFTKCPYLSLTNYRCCKQCLWRWPSIRCMTNCYTLLAVVILFISGRLWQMFIVKSLRLAVA
jgi:hypothetical protein